MKMFGRILIILLAIVLMMGITYAVVNASGSATNASAFQRGGEGFPPNGGQHEFRDGGRGGGGIGMMFGLMKNSIIVGMIVALVAFPKNYLQQRRRAAPVRID